MNDEEEETEYVEVPCWRFSFWEIPAVLTSLLGGTLHVIGNHLNYVSRECQAAANHGRQTAELREAQALHEAGQAQIERSLRETLGITTFEEGP